MVNTPQRHTEPPIQIESYKTAVQLYSNEFTALGTRTNAFLIVQSVLIAAFVHVLASRPSFPMAFELLALGIAIVGILYCFLHHGAGQSGSQAALRWRQFMRDIESNQHNTPWNYFYRLSHHTHRELRLQRLFIRLRCEGCLLERLPLPSSWLLSPSIFLLAWGAALAYIFDSWAIKQFGLTCWLIIIYTLVSLIILALAIYVVIRWYIAWSRTTTEP